MHVHGEWCEVKRDLQIALNTIFNIPASNHHEFDSLISVNDLEELGYSRNFPHLTCMLCSISPELHQEFSDGKRDVGSIINNGNIRFGLLPATCYQVYLDHRDSEIINEDVIGCEARCYRFEDKAIDSFRGYNFTMKEFVYLGNPNGAASHVNNGMLLISRLLDHLGIAHVTETASDPFFDTSSSTATFSKIAPTKTEIVFDGHAIASLNIHRTYFGKKFHITIDGNPISTSCVAFGIERWISMLQIVFETPSRAKAALHEAIRAFGGPD